MAKAGATQTGTDAITPRERKLVGAWAVGVAALAVLGGAWVVSFAHRHKIESNARHLARIDPNAVEPGTTEAERSPPPGHEQDVPVEVRVGVYLDHIPDISLREEHWTADFYVWFRWNGDAANPGETFQVVNGQIESRNKVDEHVAGADHYVLYRVRAHIAKAFDTTRFPCDDHVLTINLEDTARPSYELHFVPDADSSLSSRVRVTGYRIYQQGAVVKPHSYRTARGDPDLPPGFKATYSQFTYGVWIARPGFGFYLKVFQALYAAVGIALLAFCIKPTDVDPRFGLGVGAFFAAIANTYVASTLLPDAGIMTLTDMVNGVAIVTIFLSLVQSTISLYLYDVRGKEALSRLFDRVSLAVFAVAYVAINLAIPLAATV